MESFWRSDAQSFEPRQLISKLPYSLGDCVFALAHAFACCTRDEGYSDEVEHQFGCCKRNNSLHCMHDALLGEGRDQRTPFARAANNINHPLPTMAPRRVRCFKTFNLDRSSSLFDHRAKLCLSQHRQYPPINHVCTYSLPLCQQSSACRLHTVSHKRRNRCQSPRSTHLLGAIHV